MSNTLDPNGYPDWFKQMAQDFLDMRDAQAAYFKHVCDSNLRISKAKEAKADTWLAHLLKEGTIQRKQKPVVKTNTLF